MTSQFIVIVAISIAAVIGMFVLGKLSDGKSAEEGKEDRRV